MNIETMKRRMELNQDAQLDRRVKEELVKGCTDAATGVIRQFEDGTLVRADVLRVACRGCGLERFNDGTRCKNIHCGLYYNMLLAQEAAEDERL